MSEKYGRPLTEEEFTAFKKRQEKREPTTTAYGDLRRQLSEGTLNPETAQNFRDSGLGLARSIGQGVFGLGDEVTAALRSLGSDRTYEDLREEERAEIAKFRQDNPGVAITAELLSGFVVPGGIFAKAAKGAGWVKSALTGAGEGAVYAAGASEAEMRPWEDPEYQKAFEQITSGAATGAALAPAFKKLFELGGRGLDFLLDRQGARQAKTDKVIRNKMSETEANVDSYRVGGDKELAQGSVLADIPELQGLAYQTAAPDSVRQVVRRQLDARNRASRDQFNSQFKEAFNTYQLEPDDHIALLRQNLKIGQTERYLDAYDAVPSLPVADLVAPSGKASDMMRTAYDDARKTVDELIDAEVRGWTPADRLPDNLDDFISGNVGSTKQLHQILQAVGDKAYNNNTDTATLITAYQGRYKKFQQALEDANPQFAEAQTAHHIVQRQAEAVKLGKKALRKSVEEIKQEIAKLPEDAKKAYRSGLYAAVNAKRSTGSLATMVRDTKAIAQKLAATFDDPREMDSFLDFVKQQAMQDETNKWLFKGPGTAQRLTQSTGTRAVQEGISGGFFGPVYMLWSSLKTIGGEMVGKSIKKKGKQLGTTMFDPSPQRQLDRIYAPDSYGGNFRNGLLPPMAGGAGVSAGAQMQKEDDLERRRRGL